MKNINAFLGNSEEEIKKIQSESVDVICIDPPYLYLKNQKLEREFDEKLFFEQCKRILTKNGFIIMFGRGVSFYRWNCILADLGFNFKEEIVWNKNHCSSPLMRVSRVHETVSIFCKGNQALNKVKVPYLEMKQHDIPSIIQDIKRMKSVFSNTKSFDAVKEFLKNNILNLSSESKNKFNITRVSDFKNADRAVGVVNMLDNGMNEKSIIRVDRLEHDTTTKHNVSISKKGKIGDRCVNVVQSQCFGMNEKTIINQTRDHYSSIHPTQKPVRLLERLLNLCLPDKPKEEIIVADFFAGSFSCAEACNNLGVGFIGYEIDQEYYDLGMNRLKNLQPKLL